MADVLNTSTLEMRQSVPGGVPPYDAAPWMLITRDLSTAWMLIPQQYRKWDGSVIEEMTGPEKSAVDSAALVAMRDGIVQQLDQQEDILRWMAGVMVDELNAHTERTNALLDAIDAAASLAALKTSAAGIANLPIRDLAQLRTAMRNKAGV